MTTLCDRRSGGRSDVDVGAICSRRSCGSISRRSIWHSSSRTIGFSRCAVLADVAGLAALVAGLSNSIQWTAIGSGAVP